MSFYSINVATIQKRLHDTGYSHLFTIERITPDSEENARQIASQLELLYPDANISIHRNTSSRELIRGIDYSTYPHGFKE